MAMDADEVIPDFDLVVEDSGTSPLFPLPAGWCSVERTIGALTVTVVEPLAGSDATKTANGIPIVTFHDVGLSASTCFASFFTFAYAAGGCPDLYGASAHYHMTAPGCAPDAPSLPASFPFKSFGDLGADVNAALSELGIRRAIGLGAGAGASVVAEAARAAPRLWAGLVLVSPLLSPSSYYERGLAMADGAYVRGLGLGGRVKERFLQRWLSPETLDSQSDLVTILDASVDRLNAGNVVRYMDAEAWRDGVIGHLREIKAKVMLVTGRESMLREDSAENFSELDPTRTTWMDVPGAGGLVHEEVPERVAKGLSLFLQGFGVYEPSAT